MSATHAADCQCLSCHAQRLLEDTQIMTKCDWCGEPTPINPCEQCAADIRGDEKEYD